jgi:hypothetical protein
MFPTYGISNKSKAIMTTLLNIKKEITMDAIEANVKTIRLIVPIILLFGFPYYLLWPNQFTLNLIGEAASKTWLILVFIILGAVLHEIIHGLFWSFFLKNGFKSIKFGVVWKLLTPYCHSKKPMKMKHYRLGAIMPCVILGLIPATISIFVGHLGMLAFGMFFTIAAGGDLLMIWMLRNENKNELVQDHPDKIGCLILN